MFKISRRHTRKIVRADNTNRREAQSLEFIFDSCFDLKLTHADSGLHLLIPNSNSEMSSKGMKSGLLGLKN